jgi:hypothetical protein
MRVPAMTTGPADALCGGRAGRAMTREMTEKLVFGEYLAMEGLVSQGRSG